MRMLPELDEVTKRRKVLGLTQAELARLVGVSRSLIAKVETRRAIPSYAKAKLIFDTLEALERERMARPGLRGLTVDQIHTIPVEWVESSDSVHSVWVRMVETAYSQFPVRDGAKTVGSITERTVNSALMVEDPREVGKLPVSAMMDEPFPTVGVKTPVSAVIPLLRNSQAVLTVEGGNTGIVTNADVGKVFDLIKR